MFSIYYTAEDGQKYSLASLNRKELKLYVFLEMHAHRAANWQRFNATATPRVLRYALNLSPQRLNESPIFPILLDKLSRLKHAHDKAQELSDVVCAKEST